MDENITRANNRMQIDIFDVWYIIRQKLWLVVLAMVLCGFAAGLYAYFFVTPLYESTAAVYIVSASNDSVVNLSDLQLGSSLTADYGDLLTRRPVLESVIERLGLEDYSTKQLRSMITISNPNDTRVLEITVTSPDPEFSANIANEMATMSVEWLPVVMKCEEPTIAEDAIPDYARVYPNYTKYAISGIIVGALIVLALLFIKYVRDDSIHSREEFERIFGIETIAVIPKIVPAQAKQLPKSQGKEKAAELPSAHKRHLSAEKSRTGANSSDNKKEKRS